MRRIFAVLNVACIILLCGCNGYHEIDRGYLVTAMGICKNNGDVQIFVEAQSSATTDKNIERSIFTGHGNNIADAVENLKHQLVKPLYFEQIGTVVFQGDPSQKDLMFLIDTLKIHYGIFLVQSNDVNALFNLDPPGKILGYDIIGLIKNFEKANNINTNSRLFQVLKFNNSLSKIDIKNNKLFFIFEGEKT